MKVELIDPKEPVQELFSLDELPFGLFTDIEIPDRVYLKTPGSDGTSYVVIRLMGAVSRHSQTVFAGSDKRNFTPLRKDYRVVLRND